MKANTQLLISAILLVGLIYWIPFAEVWTNESWYVWPTKFTVGLVLGFGVAGFFAYGIANKSD